MHPIPHSPVTSKYVAQSGNENEWKLKRHSGGPTFTHLHLIPGKQLSLLHCLKARLLLLLLLLGSLSWNHTGAFLVPALVFSEKTFVTCFLDSHFGLPPVLPATLSFSLSFCRLPVLTEVNPGLKLHNLKTVCLANKSFPSKSHLCPGLHCGFTVLTSTSSTLWTVSIKRWVIGL